MIRLERTQMMTPGDLDTDLNLCVCAADTSKQNEKIACGLLFNIAEIGAGTLYQGNLIIRDTHIIYDTESAA